MREAKYTVIMMNRIVNNLVAIPSSHHHMPLTSISRGHHDRYLILFARHSFLPDTIRIWNGLPVSLVTCTTLESFKQGVPNVKIQ